MRIIELYSIVYHIVLSYFQRLSIYKSDTVVILCDHEPGLDQQISEGVLRAKASSSGCDCGS